MMAKLFNQAAFKRLEEFPEWMTAQERLTALKLRRDAAEQRVVGLIEQIGGFGERDKKDGVSALERQAQRLVAGEDTERRESVTLGGLSADFAAAQQDRATLIRAVEIQRSLIAELHGRLSREICASIEPRYHERVTRLVRAVRAVAELNDEVGDFLKEIDDAGISPLSLRNMQFHGAGKLSDEYSRASHYLREAEEFGFKG